jgi:hypothetical protein
MNKKQTKHQRGLLTLFCSFIFYGLAFAQYTDLQVIATDGGCAESPQLRMSWTVGQISTSTASGGAIIATQGFQQSFPLLSALPVELLDFTATKIEKTVELNWQTASERNNVGFEIERSSNDQNWEVIGFVEGRGNSFETQDYSFIDTAPNIGNNYYRLKQVDFDGHYEYSSIRHILFTANNKSALSIYPNPNGGQFTVGINNPDGKRAVVQLFTSSGALIWKESFFNGEMPPYWEKEFILEQREMYFIVSQIGEEISSKKVAVIKKD